MDTNALKGRIAEALVELIFRQAGYVVSRLGRETQVQRLVKVGADEFTPDFLVWRPVTSSAPDLHQLLTVEVKYRASLADFLRRDAGALFAEAQRAWPNLYFVLVTDEPDEGRSCFQAVALRDYIAGAGVPATLDLRSLPNLDIYASTIEEHEAAARVLFGALAAHRLPPRRVRQAMGAAESSESRRLR